MKTATNAPLGKDVIGLAALFLTSGTMHFVKPEPFEAMVPQQLPSRRGLVYASGALEIACAVGLFVPRTRRVAGLVSAALLVAVFPANVTMTGQAKRRLDRAPDDAKRQGYLAATVARLPLQWPMIRTALRAGGVMR
ncbi:DoxX family protein [Terrabacter aerolatus]|uniref:Membrane protein n=1 Tax=Terrabacter aerolatus TaxID=422442 RepID=A0A512CY60_9MICO|nr:MauE/DoxX family redox-associated membrane protein [Terrabacter aerolatus]GEO28950.1 membrane protein [Terrabacter aerolatus]